MNALKYHWCETILLATTNCFEACDVQRFHLQEICAIKGLVLYPAKNEEICGIVPYQNVHVTLATFKT